MLQQPDSKRWQCRTTSGGFPGSQKLRLVVGASVNSLDPIGMTAMLCAAEHGADRTV